MIFPSNGFGHPIVVFITVLTNWTEMILQFSLDEKFDGIPVQLLEMTNWMEKMDDVREVRLVGHIRGHIQRYTQTASCSK